VDEQEIVRGVRDERVREGAAVAGANSPEGGANAIRVRFSPALMITVRSLFETASPPRWLTSRSDLSAVISAETTISSPSEATSLTRAAPTARGGG